MKIENLDTIEALEEFLLGNQLVAFSVLGKKNGTLQLHSKNTGQI